MASSNSGTTAAGATGANVGGGDSGGGVGGSPSYYIQNIGLGYAISIALGVLILLSTALLASYFCCRSSRSRPPNPNRNSNSSNTDGIILPNIFFVAEDDVDMRDEENAVVGLDQMVINSYPKFPFCKSKLMGSGGDSMCSICLCDYKDEEMMRMMPDCRHFFHLCCVDAWLRLHPSCPVCRNSPLPTPLSTPLSELVPLSHYPDNRRR